MVVPGALRLIYPTPSDDVPNGRDWADCVSADGRTARRFSPDYFASLLADLGVSAAKCLGRASTTSTWALGAHGVAPLDL